jgi:hypothetical protein
MLDCNLYRTISIPQVGAQIIAVVETGGEGLEHLFTSTGAHDGTDHQALGWIVVVLLFLQIASGFARPSAKKATNDKQQQAAGTSTPEEGVSAEQEINQEDDEANKSGVEKPADESAVDDDDNKKPCIRVAWELQHRFLGFGALGLAWYTAHTGLDKFESKFPGEGDGIGIFFWTSAVVLAAVIAVLTLYAKVFRRES